MLLGGIKVSKLVEICNAEWEIREINGKTIERRMGYPCDAYTDYDKQKIYLARELHPHRKGVALTHEFGHVILDYIGVPDELHEDLIRKVEHSVYQLVINFPEKYK